MNSEFRNKVRSIISEKFSLHTNLQYSHFPSIISGLPNEFSLEQILFKGMFFINYNHYNDSSYKSKPVLNPTFIDLIFHLELGIIKAESTHSVFLESLELIDDQIFLECGLKL
jgi:hypothetical protein